MSDFAPKVYEYNLLSNAALTVEQVGELKVCSTYAWSVSWCVTGALETDVFKIALEYSNDGINWDLYSCCTIIDNCLKGGFFDSTLPFLYIRIHTEPDTVEPGAVIDAKLILKFNR